MKEIRLSQGKVTVIDDEDLNELSQHKWCAWKNTNGAFYAVRNYPKDDKKRKIIRLHRHLMGVTDPKIYVDHINGDTLDNRKENLRLCSPKENPKNRTKIHVKNTSGYRGVSKRKNTTNKIWVAQIMDKEGKRLGLGYFETPEEAAIVFDEAAISMYGEFCGKLNFERDQK